MLAPQRWCRHNNVQVEHFQKYNKISNVHKIEGVHLQCVNNLYAKFEYKGMKTVELQITQIRHPLSILDGKSSTPSEMKNYSRNVHKIGLEVHIFNV